MKTEFTSRLYNAFFGDFRWESLYCDAKEEIQEYYPEYLPRQKGLEIIGETADSKLFPVFCRQIGELRYDKLFKSFIHGVDHVERVCLNTLLTVSHMLYNAELELR